MNAHIQRSSAHLLITSRDLFAFCQVIIALPCSWFLLSYCRWLQGSSLDWFQSSWSLQVGETSRNKGIGTGHGQEQECGKIAADHHAWFGFIYVRRRTKSNRWHFISFCDKTQKKKPWHIIRQVQPKRCCNRYVRLVPRTCMEFVCHQAEARKVAEWVGQGFHVLSRMSQSKQLFFFFLRVF